MFISMFNLVLEFDKEFISGIWIKIRRKMLLSQASIIIKIVFQFLYLIWEILYLYFSTLLTLRLKESLSCATWSRVNFDHEALHTAPPW